MNMFLKFFGRKPKPWHKELSSMSPFFGAGRNIEAHDWNAEMLGKFYAFHSVQTGHQVFSRTFRGYFEPQKKKEIFDFFEKGRKAVSKKIENEYEHSENYIFLGQDDIVEMRYASSNVSITVRVHDESVLDKAQEFMSNVLSRRAKNNNGKAHVLSQGYDGIQTQELGVVAVPLTLENYTASVRDGLKEIVKDLKSPLPNGKLTILEGVPGTGKTFLIRSLISEIPNAFFVIIPPSMVSRLGDPQLIPVLLRLKSHDDEDEDLTDEELISKEKEKQNSNPIVLIVEDADECLVKRDASNMSTISTVLNLTSGILGDLLDIRIIASTNAKFVEMDEALTRDGRMSYHLEVGKLKFEEACDIYKRLLADPDAQFMPDTKDFKDVLLATVYKEAKRKGYREETDQKAKSRTNLNEGRGGKKRATIGFSTS